jgi:hypothetical protein
VHPRRISPKITRAHGLSKALPLKPQNRSGRFV